MEMAGVLQDLLKKMIQGDPGIKVVYLFGSHADGTATRRSGIDGREPLAHPVAQFEHLHLGTDEGHADSDVVQDVAHLGLALYQGPLSPLARGEVTDVALDHLAMVHEVNIADKLHGDGPPIEGFQRQIIVTDDSLSCRVLKASLDAAMSLNAPSSQICCPHITS